MDKKRYERFLRSLNYSLRSMLALSSVVFIWTLSVFLISLADLPRFLETASPARASDLSGLATVLFGASSIALFILSLVFAAVVSLGWQSIVSAVRQTALEAVRNLNDPLRGELMGRQLTHLGYLTAELSIDPDSLAVSNRKRLSEGIRLCQEGYDLLKVVGGPAEIMALNNLVFFSAISGERFRGDFLLKSARRLMEAGQESNNVSLQLTACRVILQYGIDREEARKAYELVSEIASGRDVSEREKREAQKFLDATPEP